MNAFITTGNIMHPLSVSALQEASRLGQRTADIDHLFIALISDDYVAGRALHSLGITLDAARKAVADQSLQAREPEPSSSSIFHSTGSYEWSERALEVMRSAFTDDRHSSISAALLRALVLEPGCAIQGVLRRLGTTADMIIAQAQHAERNPIPRAQHRSRPERIEATLETFVGVPPEEAWRLLSSPSRITEWEPGTGEAAHAPPVAQAGASWLVCSPTAHPDGRRIRLNSDFEMQWIEIVSFEEGSHIGLRFSYPHAPQANTRRVGIKFEATAEGTRLTISLTWERHPTRLLGILTRPRYRYAFWTELSYLMSGINRMLS